MNIKSIHKVTSFCYNGPCVPFRYAPVLQITVYLVVLYRPVFYRKGRVLKLYKLRYLINFLSFSCWLL